MIETIPNDILICIKDFLDNYDIDYPDTDNIMNISSEDYKIFIRLRLESKAESIIVYLSGNNFMYETDKIFDVLVLPYGHILEKYHVEGNIPDNEADKVENELVDKISVSIKNYISDTEKIINSEIKFKKPFKNILSSKDEEIISPNISKNIKDELKEFEENKKVFNVSILPKELPNSLYRLIKVYDKIQVTFDIYNEFLGIDLPINLFIEKNKNLANILYVYTYIARCMYSEDQNQIAHSLKKNYIFDCDIPGRDIPTAVADINNKNTLIKGIYSAVEACVSYMKKVGNGKITYKIYVYRRTEL